MKIVTPQQLTKLKKIFKTGRRLVIFMHNNPDPDALASALILKHIAKHFKVPAKIILHGTPNQEENHTMIRLLKIPLETAASYTYPAHTLTAIVDCQKTMKNHSFPEELSPDITLDHHLEKKVAPEKELSFSILVPEVGATASLAMDIFLNLKLSLTSVLATAYAYALLSETRYLSRGFTPYDIRIYKQIVPSIDFMILSSIQNTKRPKAFYDVMNKALRSYVCDKHIIVCQLGKISNLDFVHQVAEELIRMQNVYIAIVTAKDPKKTELAGKISLRGEHPQLNLGKWLKDAIMNHGSGGGHRNMAAGNFSGKESAVIKELQKVIARQLSKPLFARIKQDLHLQ